MKPQVYFYFSVFSLLFLFGCNEANKEAPFKSNEIEENISFSGLSMENLEVNADVSSHIVRDSNGNSFSSDSEVPQHSIKLIKKADLKFNTDSIEQTHEQLSVAAKNLGGFISNENQSNQTHRNTSTMTIRLPSAKFDKLIEICDGLGSGGFDRRNISANDVTEEFLDLSARIKTKKELESRYHDLLKKAKNVEEVIQVEREIGKLRAQIESSEGRLNYLSNRVSLSTVEIEFYKDIEREKTVIEKPNRFVKSFISGWNGLVSFLVGLVNIWPLLLIMGTLFFLALKKWKNSDLKKNK